MKSGFRPKRTMRFVLFTGEEQGLLGSLAYVKMHKSEMPNHVAAVILDNGQGPVIGLQLGGRDDLVPAAKQFATSIQAFGKVKTDDAVDWHRRRTVHPRRSSGHQPRPGFSRLQIHASLASRHLRQSGTGPPSTGHRGHGAYQFLDRRSPRAAGVSMARSANRADAGEEAC